MSCNQKIFNIHYLPIIIELCQENEARIEIINNGLNEGLEININAYASSCKLHKRKIYDIKKYYNQVIDFFKEDHDK